MTSRRKIELILGFITVVLAFVVSLMGMKDDYEISLRLAEPFSWKFELVTYSALIMLPAAAVGLGAYSHAIKDKDWGRVLMVLGTLVLAWQFRLLFVGGVYVVTLLICLLLLLATAAALTVIASFVTASEPTS